MTTIIGKGIFLIFCGALLIGKPFNVVVAIGIAILVLGFFNILCSFFVKSDPTVKESSQAAQNAEGINVPQNEGKNLKKNKKEKENKYKADKKSNIRGATQKVDLEAAPGRQMIMI